MIDKSNQTKIQWFFNNFDIIIMIHTFILNTRITPNKEVYFTYCSKYIN